MPFALLDLLRNNRGQWLSLEALRIALELHPREIHERIEQLQAQRRRWAAGTLGLSRRVALRLIGAGLAKGDLLLADFGWTLLVLSRPLVMLHTGVTLLATIVSAEPG